MHIQCFIGPIGHPSSPFFIVADQLVRPSARRAPRSHLVITRVETASMGIYYAVEMGIQINEPE